MYQHEQNLFESLSRHWRSPAERWRWILQDYDPVVYSPHVYAVCPFCNGASGREFPGWGPLKVKATTGRWTCTACGLGGSEKELLDYLAKAGVYGIAEADLRRALVTTLDGRQTDAAWLSAHEIMGAVAEEVGSRRRPAYTLNWIGAQLRQLGVARQAGERYRSDTIERVLMPDGTFLERRIRSRRYLIRRKALTPDTPTRFPNRPAAKRRPRKHTSPAA